MRHQTTTPHLKSCAARQHRAVPLGLHLCRGTRNSQPRAVSLEACLVWGDKQMHWQLLAAACLAPRAWGVPPSLSLLFSRKIR